MVVQRYLKWGDRGQGLWASLEKEMGRSSRNILSRWKSRLSVEYGILNVNLNVAQSQQQVQSSQQLGQSLLPPAAMVFQNNINATFHIGSGCSQPKHQYDYSNTLGSGASQAKHKHHANQTQHQKQNFVPPHPMSIHVHQVNHTPLEELPSMQQMGMQQLPAIPSIHSLPPPPIVPPSLIITSGSKIDISIHNSKI